jgi:hypothetical protein
MMPLPKKLTNIVRTFNERRDNLIRIDLYVNFLMAAKEYIKTAIDVLKRYESNNGILSFKEESLIPSGDSASVKVKRTLVKDGAVGINYTLTGSTITDISGGVLTWEDGDNSDKEIVVPLVDGNEIETSDLLSLELHEPIGNAFLGEITYTEVLVNTANLDVITFELENYAVREDDGTAKVTVKRISNNYSKSVSVEYKTMNGNAKKKKDYEKTTGKLEWGPGDQEDKIISIPVRLDKKYIQELGADEYFYVKLRRPKGGALLGNITKSQVRIINAPRGMIGFEKDIQYFAEGSTGEISVTREGQNVGDVEVDYEINYGIAIEDDFAGTTQTTGTLLFKDGEEGNQVITIDIVGNDGAEYDEPFSIVLSNPTDGSILREGDEITTCVIMSTYPTISLGEMYSDPQHGREYLIPVVKREGIESTANVYPMSASYSFEDVDAVGKAVYPEIYYSIFPISGVGVSITGDNGISGFPSLSGCDYIVPSEELSMDGILGWSTPIPVEEKYLHVGIISKYMYETPKAFSVTLSNPVNATLGGRNVEEYELVSDSELVVGGVFTMKKEETALTGYANEVVFLPVLKNAGNSAVTINVDCYQEESTAIEGVDFSVVSKSLTFAADDSVQYLQIELLSEDITSKNIKFYILEGEGVTVYPTRVNDVTIDFLGVRELEEPNPVEIIPEDPSPFPITDLRINNIKISEDIEKVKIDMAKEFDVVWWSWLKMNMELNEYYLRTDTDLETIYEEILEDRYFYDVGFDPETDDDPSVYDLPDEQVASKTIAYWRKERISTYRDYMAHYTDFYSDLYLEIIQNSYDIELYDFKKNTLKDIKKYTNKPSFAHIDPKTVANQIEYELMVDRMEYIESAYNRDYSIYDFYYEDDTRDTEKEFLIDYIGGGVVSTNKRIEDRYLPGNGGTLTRYSEGTNSIFKLEIPYDGEEYDAHRHAIPGLIATDIFGSI